MLTVESNLIEMKLFDESLIKISVFDKPILKVISTDENIFQIWIFRSARDDFFNYLNSNIYIYRMCARKIIENFIEFKDNIYIKSNFEFLLTMKNFEIFGKGL
jgi:hypothetical protein